jgi:SAM-dependent methyltransferase
MERDWDDRAIAAPEYYVANGQERWEQEEFFRSGEINVDNEILADPLAFRRGTEPRRMRVLEIGCGCGRMTRALAAAFAEVHGVDISGEMIGLARRNLSGLRNVFLYENNGSGLSGLADRSFDFAFSFIVFQHIPSADVIESYVREVYRCLRPGAVFKFQVQGDAGMSRVGNDTWVGAPISLADAESLALRRGFDLILSSGEGTQCFWLWFRKPGWPWIPREIRLGASGVWAGLRALGDRPVPVSFSAESVRGGENYRVRIPRFAGQAIDVGYELSAAEMPAPVSGVVGRWCELDASGEATIPVAVGHPGRVVAITRVRSRTKGGPWVRARGSIRVEKTAE